MLHIDSTKLHSKSLWGETLKSHNNPWDNHRGMQNWPASKYGDIAVCAPRQRPIVGLCLFLQPMAPQQSYTAPHVKSYLFNYFSMLGNSSTKAVVCCFGLNAEENDWITSSTWPPSGSKWHRGTATYKSKHLLSQEKKWLKTMFLLHRVINYCLLINPVVKLINLCAASKHLTAEKWHFQEVVSKRLCYCLWFLIIKLIRNVFILHWQAKQQSKDNKVLYANKNNIHTNSTLEKVSVFYVQRLCTGAMLLPWQINFPHGGLIKSSLSIPPSPENGDKRPSCRTPCNVFDYPAELQHTSCT